MVEAGTGTGTAYDATVETEDEVDLEKAIAALRERQAKQQPKLRIRNLKAKIKKLQGHVADAEKELARLEQEND